MNRKTIKLILLGALLSLVMACNNSQTSQQSITSTKTQTTVQQAAVNIKNVEVEAAPKCGMPYDGGGKDNYVSKEVKVMGEVANPVTLTVASLKKMNVREIKDKKMICACGSDKNMDDIHSAKGVLLRDILFDADILQKNHKDRSFYIVVRATDNFTVLFSWSEIFNTIIGDGAYLIFEENGKPLTDKGEMMVESFNDKKMGRHINWVKSIEVYRL
ncbi:hypothetical protein SAMN05444369_10233 [Capnocytophaga haemolytica]|jgi:hypothetical protein|uniref:Oxidoreductase molybdopterin binding domain n=1 Tax=Capnocytophaga haemolytica TaxID=45243 RepID=A0AAX2GWZ7_9FLAO|nr:hypothetical protein [Capnocytophaga haemolytica]AMD84745.1 hypothetical protein AXF12_03955 [Capnocytophaga haemolytica]SFN72987.1 hypothetical protein SAMN05444369_10233 [Capnocytophaga haemolytica]SNV07890.1 Oxidoreductase molybdopterin binding domain [Capnocytophaga haemolytica]